MKLWWYGGALFLLPSVSVFCVLHLDEISENPTLIPFKAEPGYTRYSMVKSPRTLESACFTHTICQRSLISSTDRSVKTARKSVEFRSECDATTTTIYITTDKPPAREERLITNDCYVHTEIPAPEGRVGHSTMEQGWVPAVTDIILQTWAPGRLDYSVKTILFHSLRDGASASSTVLIGRSQKGLVVSIWP